MAGRAGRRGLDEQGYAVLLISTSLSAAEGEEMLSRRFAPLHSRFSLRFSTLLKLLRTEGASPSSVLLHTLSSWQAHRARRASSLRAAAVREELAAIDAAAAASPELHASADEYLLLRLKLQRLGSELSRRVFSHARQWLTAGRLVRIYGQPGWCVLVSAHGFSSAGVSSAAGEEEEAGAALGVDDVSPVASQQRLHVLVTGASTRQRRLRAADAAWVGTQAEADAEAEAEAAEMEVAGVDACEVAGGAKTPAPRAAPAADDDPTASSPTVAAAMSVVGVPLSSLRQLSAVRLWMPRDLGPSDARASVALALRACVASFESRVPLLDPIEDMELEDSAVLRGIDAVELAEAAVARHPLHGQERLREPYARCHRRRTLRRELKALQAAEAARERAAVPPLSIFGGITPAVAAAASRPEAMGDGGAAGAMLAALRALGHVDGEHVPLLKGRVACCVEANELLAAELLVQGAFNDLDVPETAALLVCLLPQASAARAAEEAEDEGPIRRGSLPTRQLERALSAARRAAERLAAVLRDCGLPPTPPVAAAAERSLLRSVYAWVGGASFEASWRESPATFEGSLVRSLRGIDELLKQMGEAAAALGDHALRARFAECGKALHRGIPFAASLYLAD